MTVRITHLTDPAGSATRRRLAWVATAADDGRPLGVAFLRLPSAGGSAELDVQVHPAERRAGVGTRLLRAATGAASSIRTVPVPEDSPAAHFCRARGMRQVLALTFTRLRLSGAPTEPGAPPAGYRVNYGTGVLPEHRGRGLALHLKRMSIAHVRTRFPALKGMLADTADSNTPMRHINEVLGYRPTHRSLLYQLDPPPT